MYIPDFFVGIAAGSVFWLIVIMLIAVAGSKKP